MMITVGLIGVLAAIAIPNFVRYQARSRRSEAYANLASLARAYKAYGAETGVYPNMFTVAGVTSLPDPGPYGGLGTGKMSWDGATSGFFDTVGWKAEGQVYYSYDVAAGCNVGGSPCPLCFTATAHGDVDGDTGVSAVMYVHPKYDAVGNPLGECTSALFNYPPPLRDGSQVYDEVAVQGTTDDF
ncbi:MAG: hypothetical protein AAF430_01765 [Myxococcota bacterium]